MSELIQKHDNRATIRRKLLTGVSALALTVYVSTSSMARAEDSAQPQIWIELGGQLSRLDDGQEAFSPLLMSARPSIFSPSQKFERPPLYSIDEYGKISFQPDSSDWVFSASVHYGRSASSHHVRQQTNPAPFIFHGLVSGGGTYTRPIYASAARFANTDVRNSEQHFILDFQAGKDVGLGMFGSRDGSSTVSVGMRFAQFKSKLNGAFQSDPDWHFNYKYNGTQKILISNEIDIFHSNVASIQAARSFHGIGPSLSWNASAPLAGNTQNGALAIDWGLNAALLFGRQRTKVHHQSTAYYHGAKYYVGSRAVVGTPININHTRSRSVTVPNVGGFAGLTYRIENFKISAGYRADFFFGAMDGGIDATKKENVGFNGPYASISIGLGD